MSADRCAYVAVALKAELPHIIAFEKFGICRPVRRMAYSAALDLQGRVLEDERPLLVCVTLDAGRIRSRSEPRLLLLKSAMRIMAIAATYRPLKHLVMKRHTELRLRLVMALDAEVRLFFREHLERRYIGRMRRVAIRATHIVAPVLAPAIVVVLFFACVATETGFRDRLCRNPFEVSLSNSCRRPLPRAPCRDRDRLRSLFYRRASLPNAPAVRARS